MVELKLRSDLILSDPGVVDLNKLLDPLNDLGSRLSFLLLVIEILVLLSSPLSYSVFSFSHLDIPSRTY